MEIDYSKYYWQNELVRLRPSTVEDWKHFYLNYFDNPARFLLDNEVELPLTPEGVSLTGATRTRPKATQVAFLPRFS